MESHTQDGATRLILTGAGFTHNIGTPLASGVWELIFNHQSVQATKAVKDLMVRNFSYEDVYHVVRSDGAYTESDRSAINEALLDAFRDIDAIVKAFGIGGQPPHFNLAGLEKAVEDLIGRSGRWFTLNHDVFMERWYGRPIWLPCVPRPRIAAEDAPTVFHMPNAELVERAKTQVSEDLHYIKLHGSRNWLTEHGLIVGHNKRTQIEDEPLLKWYNELFRAAVLRPRADVLCIGYGFRDGHINEILEEGIGSGARLHVVDSQDPGGFFGRLHDQSHTIAGGVASYHQCTLADLFPIHTHATDGSRTQQLRRLYRDFLGKDPGPN